MTRSTSEGHDTVLVEDREFDSGLVRLITLNRPAKRNALDTQLLTELLQAYTAADADAGVRAIVLKACGPVFCAGGDTSEFRTGQTEPVIDRARIMTDVLAYPSTLASPVVAAVHGPALGAGAALALSADLVVAGEAFSLGYPELPNGAYPPLVIPSALAHMNRNLAFELVTTGRRLGAEEALACGVVNRIAEHSVDAEALALAAVYARFDASLVAATKKLFYRQVSLPTDVALREGLHDLIARQ
ncbi:enoyl-CoA hydratase/isomerase family protein [Rhodococcus opacus]|uniref:Enoyl-CoA hydratase/isomerase family protein n=1 Tax=Rhodococcus opacus TaxID=37919 RepID=A0AAX3YQZ1_RHOOP|nr:MULTISPECIES: enoyl-CoA hydratase/isomerase family protein [Rhodococcus]MCZ4586169.1 enoyl-CoA hydratase/isomerase family protein [Rhodococcus opacus]QSE86045.1 enoyl-CoA hydratase/isomerase family protein [Rhodococcus koreensis]WLF51897.1 enoyl-CoA hydratase/isomerase family protein [Rhodococcus opacus]